MQPRAPGPSAQAPACCTLVSACIAGRCTQQGPTVGPACSLGGAATPNQTLLTNSGLLLRDPIAAWHSTIWRLHAGHAVSAGCSRVCALRGWCAAHSCLSSTDLHETGITSNICRESSAHSRGRRSAHCCLSGGGQDREMRDNVDCAMRCSLHAAGNDW